MDGRRSFKFNFQKVARWVAKSKNIWGEQGAKTLRGRDGLSNVHMVALVMIFTTVFTIPPFLTIKKEIEKDHPELSIPF